MLGHLNFLAVQVVDDAAFTQGLFVSGAPLRKNLQASLHFFEGGDLFRYLFELFSGFFVYL